ncbi:hypothetical protein L3X38_032161 [Prunus dulcis]|uniref:Uncharacterized protein n=1 Tax=Prunus dulcis TaxID=3755 RepID=A0AAD4VEZ2_PRUDU|nr:hypothetical protein L3X38_032161 [Prunus dulcis]
MAANTLQLPSNAVQAPPTVGVAEQQLQTAAGIAQQPLQAAAGIAEQPLQTAVGIAELLDGPVTSTALQPHA